MSGHNQLPAAALSAQVPFYFCASAQSFCPLETNELKGKNSCSFTCKTSTGLQ